MGEVFPPDFSMVFVPHFSQLIPTLMLCSSLLLLDCTLVCSSQEEPPVVFFVQLKCMDSFLQSEDHHAILPQIHLGSREAKKRNGMAEQ